MDFQCGRTDDPEVIVDLFGGVFAESEGPEEGAVIRQLASDLIHQTPDEDLVVFTAWEESRCVGAICFSRLCFAGEDQVVFLLSPVAVLTAAQGKGVGQGLLSHGLKTLGRRGVDVVVTYGDPAYYRQVGFEQVSAANIVPPFALTQPEGWLAQSLNGRPLAPLRGPARCVAAFRNPAYW